MEFKLLTSDDGQLITHRYASLGAFTDYQAAHLTGGYQTRMAERSKRENLAFSGVASMDEAISRARKGLPESGLKVLAASRSLTASAMKQASRIDMRAEFDVSGAFVDMGRYVEGTPECMVETYFDTTPVVAPVVTIVSNCNASWTVDKDDLTERGRLVVALIKAVETSGRSTELWVDSTNAAGYDATSGHFRISVCVKRANQPLDMGAAMFAFTDPSMLRGLMFNAMHALPKKLHRTYGVGGGYGRVVREPIRVDQSYGPGAVYLPAVRHGDKAERTVTNVLTQLGIA